MSATTKPVDLNSRTRRASALCLTAAVSMILSQAALAVESEQERNRVDAMPAVLLTLDTSERVNFHIKAQPMSEALLELGEQSGLTIIAETALTRGLKAPEFSTLATVDQAFRRLLDPVGLRAHFLDNKTVAITLAGENEGELGAMTATPVRMAQVDRSAQVAATSPLAAEQLEEVVVSGSRITREGFTSPTPVTTLDSSAIEQKGAVNVASVLNDIPAFRPSTTDQSASQVNTATGANYADLRGLGSMRTLVLMNGERVVPQIGTFNAGTSNQVDLNIFPSIAIQRVDVVTGGASSAWGSDAVAGVVNLQMYRRYDGLKVDVQTGLSSRSDNRNNAAQILAGTSFFEDRAHVVVAGAWSKNEGVGDISSRPWWGDHAHILPDSTRCSTCYLAGEEWQMSTSAPGGVITGASLVGGGTTSSLNNIAFGTNGEPYNMPQGYFRSGSNGLFGGSVPNNYDNLYVPFKPPSERLNFYGNLDFDFTDDLTGFLTVNYSERKAKNFTNAMIINYTINSGNPFIPASIQQRMTDSNIASFNIGVKHLDILTPPDGENPYEVSGETERVSAGFNWRMGGGWKLDGYAAYGDNLTHNFGHNQRNFANARQAADAILLNGVIVCRDPSNGCVPLNLFGVGSASPAALEFMTDDQHIEVSTNQRAVALNLSGEPFSTWAGPVSIATGAEYREERKKDEWDALSLTGALQNGGTPLNYSGEMDVKEGYFETAIPLVSGVTAIERLELNAAFRATDYSTAGRVDTWKAGAIWEVTDTLLFRGTVSRDIRAPSLTELFTPQTRTTSVAVPGQPEFAEFFTGGNPDLKSEVADGKLFGVTYRPSELFGATLDFYDLELSDVITQANQVTIVNACLAGDANACSQWVRDPSGKVTRIIGGFSNISAVELRGVDAELFSAFGLGVGKLQLRLQGTYTDRMTYQVAADQPVEDYAGQNARGIVVNSPFWVPRFRGSLNVGYHLDQLTASLTSNYISSGVNEHLITTEQYARNDVPAYWKHDLHLAYRFGQENQVQVYGVVGNLLDEEPPFVPNTSLAIPTSPLYDTIGRTYLLGVRYSL
jgi:iron complex outermembrane recepter protein